MAERAQFSGRMPAGGPRSALVVAVLLVAFVGLAVAKPWEAPRPAPTPTATAATAIVSPSAAASGTASPTPPPTLAPTASPDATAPFTIAPPAASGAAWPAVRWQVLPPGSPLWLVSRVVHWPGGYLALGGPAHGSEAVWASSDGGAWDPVPPGRANTLWPGLSIIGTASIGSTLWAVTADARKDTAGGGLPLGLWRTSDGLTWDVVPTAGLRSPPDSLGPILFAAQGSTLILAWSRPGVNAGAAHTELWTSPDGAGWQIAPADTLPAGFEIQALSPAPGGGILAAGRIVTSTGRAAAALLRSADGRHWTRVPLPRAPGLPATTYPAVVWVLLPAASGILAIGATGGSPPGELWWQSADGRAWTPLRGFWPLDTTPCGEGCGVFPAGLVGSDGTRLVELGTKTGYGFWTSRDARRWSAADIAGDAAVAPDAGDELVLLPGGVIVRAGDRGWLGEAVAAGG